MRDVKFCFRLPWWQWENAHQEGGFKDDARKKSGVLESIGGEQASCIF